MPKRIAEGVYVLIDVGKSMLDEYKSSGESKLDVAIECV